MEPPFIKLEALENLINLRNQLVEEDKYVLVRSFPGPVGSPILSVGGLSTPQLPEHYPYPNPADNLEVQKAMKVKHYIMGWFHTCDHMLHDRTCISFHWLCICVHLLVTKCSTPTVSGMM